MVLYREMVKLGPFYLTDWRYRFLFYGTGRIIGLGCVSKESSRMRSQEFGLIVGVYYYVPAKPDAPWYRQA